MFFSQSQRAQGLNNFDRGFSGLKYLSDRSWIEISIEPLSVFQEGPRKETLGLKFSIGVDFFQWQGPLGSNDVI